ncbi:MAG: FAD-binding oxidoreductase [Alphaproteobacteria bacterium]
MRTSGYDVPPGDSYYDATANDRPSFAALAGDAACDVAVVGGGYCGLSAALHLADAGYDVRLVEAHTVGWGASGRNGGQLHSGQRRGQDWLEAHLGLDEARRLWAIAEAAKALVKSLVNKHAIACDLVPGVIDVAHHPRETAGLHREAEHLATVYDYPHLATFTAAESRAWIDSPAYHGGVLDRDAAHLHPLNLALGLARAAADAGARLHENTLVQALDETGDDMTLTTSGGTLRAKHVVLAGNGYLGAELMPQLAGRILPLNNFILATAPLLPDQAGRLIAERAAVADTRRVINYFRLSSDNRLLFGGGEAYRRRFPADIGEFVRRPMRQVFPQLASMPVTHAWGGTLAITLQRMPGFGRLHGGRTLYAHGFSGHGVAMATMAGQLLAEAVAGTAERFDVMARLPQPNFPGGPRMRWPIQVLAMFWFGLLDRL